MRPAAALSLLIVLTVGMGCQSGPKVQPSSLSSEAQSTGSMTAGAQAPDADALYFGSSVPPPEQFVEMPRRRDIVDRGARW